MPLRVRQLFLFSFVCFSSALLQIHLNKIESIALQAQAACARKLESAAPTTRALNRALACGKTIPDSSPWKQLLTKTGLYHLVVVSGSHLVLLELALRRFPSSIFVFFSGILLLMTGLQPPLVRGLIDRFAPLDARGPFRVAAVHFITLFLFPAWNGSLSLALSTAASFGLSIRLSDVRGRFWLALALPWLFTLPLVAGFGSAHPVQLLANALFAGFLTFILTPIAYLQLLTPWWEVAWLYEGFFRVLLPLKALNDSLFQPTDTPNVGHLSFYLLSLFLISHWWNIRVLRQA